MTLCTQYALNAYKIMWLFVMFDLPTDTKTQRRDAARFRKALIKDGFSMFQFSVYIRHSPSLESATVHIARVKALVPDEGSISILRVTDKQFGDIVNVSGRKAKPPPKAPVQLEFF